MSAFGATTGTGTSTTSSTYNPTLQPYTVPTAAGVGGDGSLATTATAISTAADINAQNVTAQQAANAARIPNASGLEASSSANIASELSGQLPADVLALLGQNASEQTLGTGGNSGINYLKLLGLTSTDETKQGQSDLTAALARNPAATVTDASQFVETPYQTAQQTLAEKEAAAQQSQYAQTLASQESQYAQTQAEQEREYNANLALQQQQQAFNQQQTTLQYGLQVNKANPTASTTPWWAKNSNSANTTYFPGGGSESHVYPGIGGNVWGNL